LHSQLARFLLRLDVEVPADLEVVRDEADRADEDVADPALVQVGQVVEDVRSEPRLAGRGLALEGEAPVVYGRCLGDRWSFAFQSASPTGEPWLGPDILDELERLHAEGVRKVLVAPVGFVSDHLEILWDLDIEGREKAAELGMELGRIESMNDDPAFIEALAGVVERAQAAEPARSGP